MECKVLVEELNKSQGKVQINCNVRTDANALPTNVQYVVGVEYLSDSSEP